MQSFKKLEEFKKKHKIEIPFEFIQIKSLLFLVTKSLQVFGQIPVYPA